MQKKINPDIDWVFTILTLLAGLYFYFYFSKTLHDDDGKKPRYIAIITDECIGILMNLGGLYIPVTTYAIFNAFEKSAFESKLLFGFLWTAILYSLSYMLLHYIEIKKDTMKTII